MECAISTLMDCMYRRYFIYTNAYLGDKLIYSYIVS